LAINNVYEDVEWIHLAQNRFEKSGHINTVTEPGVYKGAYVVTS